MIPTYPYSFVDVSSVLYEQPHNISVTISCSLSEWSVLKKCWKEKQWKSTVQRILLLSWTTSGDMVESACGMTTPLQSFSSTRFEVVIPCTIVKNIILIHFHDKKGHNKWSNTMTPLTRDIATVYVKVLSCLTTSFKNFITWLLFPVDRDSFLEFTNLNENYINLIILVSETMGT